MKHLLLFCSALICLPAFTAYSHSSSSQTVPKSNPLFHSPTISDHGQVGGGGEIGRDWQGGGSTIVAKPTALENFPSAVQCEPFDAGTLRPARLPALKPPVRKWKVGRSTLSQHFEEREAWECTCTMDDNSGQLCTCGQESSLEEDWQEPGTSVSAHTSPFQLEERERSSGKHESSRQLKIGDCLNNRLYITTVLGAGAFGTVYLAKDQHTGDSVAVKVQRAGKRHWQVAQDEIRLLKAVAAGGEQEANAMANTRGGKQQQQQQ
eukprot:CAMPEP_0181299744 /NCGR_PEP_ID=MMETSP1101-20121128/6514_1 /TAXON_ID=46948 /ORGANISM="Rhodomonas abbreviata, Strain Caron Lab Isolate" /LENGTH=263 /DNA_ID=CAMNT_0023404923 /DNA_START=179 /DNA_END=967 /DNA_ORIENTATION=+